MRRLAILCFSACLASARLSAEPAPLPEPLSLPAALAAIPADHPDLLAARAERDAAAAALTRARAGDDLNVDLDLQARRIRPAHSSPDLRHDDSRAVLRASKTLYDFGRTRQATAAGKADLAAGEAHLQRARQRLRRTVMARFFDVLLADLAAAREEEAMSVAYVRFDRARDRAEAGELSEVDLLALEDRYQQARLRRERAVARQRQTRARLALALGRPNQLPDELLPPDLPGLERPLPDFDALREQALIHSPELAALRAALAAGQARRAAARAERRPTLYLQVDAAHYAREFGARDPLTAILGLNVPLWQGGRVDGAVQAADAELTRLRARLGAARQQLEQDLLAAWQDIETLQLQRQSAALRADYRDLYLDRSRAQYELEIRTDLGDAMVQQSAARVYQAETDYHLALAWERLVELTGDPAWSALNPPAAQENAP